jgi:type I restriction enzyme S subunit
MRVKLGDVCECASSNLKQSDVLDKNGDFPIYGAAGYIGNVDFYHQDKPYIAVVKDGAGIGRTKLYPANSSVIGTMQYLLPKDNILPQYLCYVVRYMHLEKYFSGATIPHIYFRDYKNEEFNLESINRQTEIIDVLQHIENIINARKQELQKLDELVKARFVEMFGDPVSNSFGLPESTLPKLGEFGRGVSKHRPRNDPKLLGGEYPLIQTGDVAVANLYITEYGSTYSELGLQQSKMWNKGTLCITIAANIAKTAILDFDACFPDSVVGFIANERTNNIFIHYWFSFFQAILESQAPESAQKNINLKILSELKVIVPEKNRQDEFAAFVAQVDKSKAAVQKALDETQLLFDSLMQEYFG